MNSLLDETLEWIPLCSSCAGNKYYRTPLENLSDKILLSLPRFSFLHSMKHIPGWWKPEFLLCSKFYCWCFLIGFWTLVFRITSLGAGIQAWSCLNWFLTWGKFGTRYFKWTAFSLEKPWQFEVSITSYCRSIGFVMQRSQTLSQLPKPCIFPGYAQWGSHAGIPAFPPPSHLCPVVWCLPSQLQGWKRSGCVQVPLWW